MPFQVTKPAEQWSDLVNELSYLEEPRLFDVIEKIEATFSNETHPEFLITIEFNDSERALIDSYGPQDWRG